MQFLLAIFFVGAVCLGLSGTHAQNVPVEYHAPVLPGQNALTAPNSAVGGSKIVGGVNVNIVNYAYQLALTSSGSFCGASIISANWALTAAHCAGGPITGMVLRAGSSLWYSGGTTYTVAQKVVHPSFTLATIDYDIAVLKVTVPFVFGCGIQPIALPLQGQLIDAGSITTVTGWGLTSTGGSMATNLQMVTLPTISQASCQSVYGTFITPRMLCAMVPAGGKSTCQGDSGGPMVLNGQLIGVTSFTSSSGCALPGKPAGFARVSELRTWIKTNTGV